ncbi:MAG TPA: hypothetical protein PKG95_01275 [Anaerolineaceae bacterium]|nr:hypothetical protein [Anaerolineaceae bacterium]
MTAVRHLVGSHWMLPSEFMKRKRLQTLLGLTILILSLALLIWASLPLPHETQVIPLPSLEPLQTPTGWQVVWARLV